MADSVEAYMRVQDGVVEYFTLAGQPLTITEGTIYVIENDIQGPF